MARKPAGTPVFKESLKNRARVPAGDVPRFLHTSRCSRQGPSSTDQNRRELYTIYLF